MQLSNHTIFYRLGTKDIASSTIYGMRQVSKQQMVLYKKSPAVASRAFFNFNRTPLQASGYVDCVAFFERHISFLYVFTFAQHTAKALCFAFGDSSIDCLNLHIKQAFNSFLDGGFVAVSSWGDWGQGG